MRGQVGIGATALLVAGLACASAESAEAVFAPGDRVRVATPQGTSLRLASGSGSRLPGAIEVEAPFVGSIAQVTADHLLLRVAGRAEHIEVRFDQMKTLERSLETKRHKGKRALVGLAIGASVGWLVGKSLGGNGCIGDGAAGATCAGEGALLFGGTGALIGALTAPPIDRWKEVPLPASLGPSVRLSISF